MSNLDSSWQASVIKLAQTGNLRAITFWLNRHLVPQGICAQVLAEPPDGLLVRVICRQAPDSDRLVRFVCNRLCKLNIESVRSVRIAAQVVGAQTVLWEKSARIVPIAEAVPHPTAMKPLTPTVKPAPVAARPAIAETLPLPELAVATVQAPSPSAAEVSAVDVEVASSAPTAVPPRPLAKRHVTNLQKPSRQSRTWRDRQRLWRQSLQQSVQGKVASLQSSSLRFTEQSVRWFSHQSSPMRAVLLGGSAVTAFMIGCGFELLGYYTDPNALPPSKATLTNILPSNLLPSGSVKAASERVTVIRPPVAQPEDPTITLVFSNSTALTRTPASAAMVSPAPDAPPPFYGIELYRQADLVMTNLEQPLSTTSHSDRLQSSSSADRSSSDLPVEDSAAVSAAEESPELIAAEESDSTEDIAALDEAETADREAWSDDEWIAESEGEETDSETQPQPKLTPLQPADLSGNSVDIVSLVDDPMMQQGATGLDNTLKLLQQSGIYPVGAGDNPQSARRPQVFEIKGQRIAYLAYSDSSPHAVNANAAGVNVGVAQQVEEDIKAIRDQVDWVVVNYGWNRELRAYPEEWQVSLAHSAIDFGADLVVGYHPTVTQGAEIYNGRAIIYSLGSTLDEYAEKPAGSYDTAALQVKLDGHNMTLEFVPIQVKRGQAERAEGEPGKTILQYIEQASSLFDQPLRSLTTLNAQLRLSLPAAPEGTMPTEPFINYPGSAPNSAPQ